MSQETKENIKGTLLVIALAALLILTNVACAYL